MDLDELLAHSVPPTAMRSPELAGLLSDLAVEAEQAARRPSRSRRAGLVAASALTVIGFGTAGAVATGSSWIPWSTGSGSTCQMQFAAGPAGPDGEPLHGTYTSGQRQRAVGEATRFLATFDYTSIDEAQAIRDWQRGEDRAIASESDPSERQPRLAGDDLAITAVGAQVWQRLAADLRGEGIPAELVVFSQGWRCQ